MVSGGTVVVVARFQGRCGRCGDNDECGEDGEQSQGGVSVTSGSVGGRRDADGIGPAAGRGGGDGGASVQSRRPGGAEHGGDDEGQPDAQAGEPRQVPVSEISSAAVKPAVAKGERGQ